MSGWSSHSYIVPESRPPRAMSDHRRLYIPESERDDDDVFQIPMMPSGEESYFVRGGGAIFCTKDNLLNSVAYINQEFQLLGLPCLKYDGNKCTSDIVFFINRFYDLLTLYHKTAAVKDDLETRNHRLSCETEHHQSTTTRMKRLHEQSNRELDQEREKLRQLNQKYKQVCNRLKSEKEEVKRLAGVLQSRDIQHKHEQKKKEREVLRLKERLHQLLIDKAPDRKVGMDLMNVVGRNEGRRATWKAGPGKQEEEMYQLLIGNYEERHRELIQENGELRDCLLSLQRELSALLKRTGDMTVTPVIELSTHTNISTSSEDEEKSVRSRLSITDLDEGYFQMPYDLVRHEIERTFKQTCDQISDSMKKSLISNVSKCGPTISLSKADSSEKDSTERRHSVCDTSDVEKLRKQIASYKAIIKQQDELIQQSLNSQSQSVENTFLHESQLLQEKENLSEQKRLFHEEKSNFERERRVFTEAAIRLGKERQAFQEERAKLLKQHFLSLSPLKETHSRKSKGDGHSSRLLPATPVFSPAKASGKISASNLPSTAELYKALGLSPVPKSEQTSGTTPATSSGRRGSHSSENTSSMNVNFSSTQERQDSFSASTTTASTPVSSAHSSSRSPTSDAAVSLENIKASLLRRTTFQRSKSEDNNL